MKKGGMLNAQLLCELTKLRHTDEFLIIDVGFPIPKGATYVDLALTDGIPSFLQTIKAVLDELVVEEAVLFEEIKEWNPEMNNKLAKIFSKQPLHHVPTAAFVERAQKAKLFIRTAEFSPYCNLILVSASGVYANRDKFGISLTDKDIKL